jgi:hypothetical protein
MSYLLRPLLTQMICDLEHAMRILGDMRVPSHVPVRCNLSVC